MSAHWQISQRRLGTLRTPEKHSDGTASTALCVNVPRGWRDVLAELFQVHHAESSAEALRALRGVAIDLLVVSARIDDEPFWSFVDRVRRARPTLAWILVGDITDADEIRARCLGVLMVLDEPWLTQPAP
jgi:hypothetical protein